MHLRSRFALPVALGLALLAAAAFAATPAPAPAPTLAPNLRGQVMILVYHNLIPPGSKTPEAQWSRLLTSFDRDLERLEAAGYRPITLRDYVTGDFALPAGTTPVVLTFDDSSTYQVKFTPEGHVSPDCALGHWMDFAKTHPDFPVHATWFVNLGAAAFSQHAFVQQKLELLVKLGSEIGNHTSTHPYFNKISPEATKKEIALGQYEIDHYLPGYDVVSFALPFGISSRPEDLAFAGEWTGPPGPGKPPVTVKWNYKAVVKVGSGPAPSPLVAGLDGHRLPRVQVFNTEFDKWMSYFEKYPGRRFVSDGRKHAVGSLPSTSAK